MYSIVLKATDFGIPQSRERLFIIGILNKEIDFELYLKNTKNIINQLIPSFF